MPENIQDIANKIHNAGGSLYLVGGSVRDSLLEIKSDDEDYCITGLSYEEFQSLFPDAKIIGKSFAVFEMDGKEFAIARKENKSGNGHTGFEIETNKDITIEEDLKRRDITINAIAKDVYLNKIIDPYNGQGDLKNGIIRAISEHFKEDPLRVYRVARFAAKFQFDIVEDTIKMMSEMREDIKDLPAERIYTEFSKALLTDKPSIFFEVLKRCNLLDIHFKYISNLIGALQPIEYHPEGDAYNHTMIVLDKVAKKTSDYTEKRKLEIRFAALVHDIGKGLTPKEEYPHHYLHEKRGVELVKKLGLKLRIPNRLIKCGITSSLEHMRGGLFKNMKDSKKIDFIERVDKTILGLDGLQIIVNADNKNSVDFAVLGKKCLSEINGTYIKNKYNVNESTKIKELLHQERIKWIKENK